MYKKKKRREIEVLDEVLPQKTQLGWNIRNHIGIDWKPIFHLFGLRYNHISNLGLF